MKCTKYLSCMAKCLFGLVFVTDAIFVAVFLFAGLALIYSSNLELLIGTNNSNIQDLCFVLSMTRQSLPFRGKVGPLFSVIIFLSYSSCMKRFFSWQRCCCSFLLLFHVHKNCYPKMRHKLNWVTTRFKQIYKLHDNRIACRILP